MKLTTRTRLWALISSDPSPDSSAGSARNCFSLRRIRLHTWKLNLIGTFVSKQTKLRRPPRQSGKWRQRVQMNLRGKWQRNHRNLYKGIVCSLIYVSQFKEPKRDWWPPWKYAQYFLTDLADFMNIFWTWDCSQRDYKGLNFQGHRCVVNYSRFSCVPNKKIKPNG